MIDFRLDWALSGQTVLLGQNYGSVVNKQPGRGLRNLKSLLAEVGRTDWPSRAVACENRLRITNLKIDFGRVRKMDEMYLTKIYKLCIL